MTPQHRENEIHRASKALGMADMRAALATRQQADAIKRLVDLYICSTCQGTRVVLGLPCPICASEFFLHKHTIDYQRCCNGCWHKHPKVLTPATRIMCWVDRQCNEVGTCPWCEDCTPRAHLDGVLLSYTPMEGIHHG